MKILLSFLIVCFACFACNDAVDLTSINKDLDNRNATVAPQDIVISPYDPYRWTRLYDPSIPAPNEYNSSGVAFKVNGSVYCATGYPEKNTYKLNENTKRWEPYAIDLSQFFFKFKYLFSYSNRIYGISDLDGRTIGAVNINTGQFHTMSPFPGTKWLSATKVVVGSDGYLLGGREWPTLAAINQFWKYDFIRDAWTDMGELPGGGRVGGTAFVVDSKIYYGLGYQTEWINNELIKKYKDDWMLIDPSNSSNVYATRANFPGQKRTGGKGFVIDGKIYVGWGNGDGTSLQDFWQFNPDTNKWIEKPQPGHRPMFNDDIGVFSAGNIGYVISFVTYAPYQFFWQYSNRTTVTPLP
jgi:hypothetical protein